MKIITAFILLLALNCLAAVQPTQKYLFNFIGANDGGIHREIIQAEDLPAAIVIYSAPEYTPYHGEILSVCRVGYFRCR